MALLSEFNQQLNISGSVRLSAQSALLVARPPYHADNQRRK